MRFGRCSSWQLNDDSIFYGYKYHPEANPHTKEANQSGAWALLPIHTPLSLPTAVTRLISCNKSFRLIRKVLNGVWLTTSLQVSIGAGFW